MKSLYKAIQHNEDNHKYLDIISYHLSKREFGTVSTLLTHVGEYTQCYNMKKRVNGLFLQDDRAKEYFGIAENIVGSMSNMVFSGNVNINVKEGQEYVDELIYDGNFLNKLKETYETAISMSNKAKAYLFFNTIQVYDTTTNVKLGDEFLDFEVVPSFYVEREQNVLTRYFYKPIYIKEKDRTEIIKFEYIYETVKGKTYLNIIGYDEEDKVLEDDLTMEILEIDRVVEHFNFVPYQELDLGKGMLPNILWIENSLAENIYFQDEDLVNSQTTTYVTEDNIYEININDTTRASYFDKYQTRKVIKGDSIDRQDQISHVQGKSAISDIERNMALNVIQACLDGKISPVSIGYSLIDKIASNTDVGVDKERASIRKRENDIIRLKVFIAKVIKTYLFIKGVEVLEKETAVIFDPYITPSVESMTNTLSKQVQFGIKSRELAVKQLNKNELNDKEVEEEYEKIKELGTQIDYNVSQREQANKGETNILKSEK